MSTFTPYPHQRAGIDWIVQHLIIKNKMQITELELYIENARRRTP